MKKYALIYQAGIANVFEVETLNLNKEGRNAKRILQSDFRSCENFCEGLKHAGGYVYSAYCNMAGDINLFDWKEKLENVPFSESFHPVFTDKEHPSYLEFKEYQEYKESFYES